MKGILRMFEIDPVKLSTEDYREKLYLFVSFLLGEPAGSLRLVDSILAKFYLSTPRGITERAKLLNLYAAAYQLLSLESNWRRWRKRLYRRLTATKNNLKVGLPIKGYRAEVYLENNKLAIGTYILKLQGYSYQEIAYITGKSVDRVKVEILKVKRSGFDLVKS